eukprot:1551568-Amphidinium_carterae.1
MYSRLKRPFGVHKKGHCDEHLRAPCIQGASDASQSSGQKVSLESTNKNTFNFVPNSKKRFRTQNDDS